MPTRSRHCSHRGEPFEPGAEYITVLSEEEVRSDYCLACWDKLKGKKKEGVLWRGRIPEKKERPPTEDEKMFLLFHRLIEEEKSDKTLLFVLALYLQRKGQLILRSEIKKEGGLFFEIPTSGEILSVEIVVVTPSQGEKIIEEIGKQLECDAR